ncbi:hypothetical protein [Solirubrum puertoriconensis]|uniref:Tissue inhibitor of metalloproteinase n=1 Tax=Solirubrum puertoriconensis TaxID=1751427 RepID=A0A9X0HHR0_SOLP1|nr:hypothetical protein [Solirubrum puertoriconensis]KUG06104.1 hypothetical protein ASU33_01685 [Solirubrum puertoriconensis]
MHKVFTLLLLVVLATTPFVGRACSCVDVSIRKGYKQSDIIFAGTLIGKAQAERLTRYTFRVNHLYKGTLRADTVSVFSSGRGEDCGSNFALNSSYLIYSWFRDAKPKSIFDSGPKVSPYLYTSLCSRNKPDRFANLYEKAVLTFL